MRVRTFLASMVALTGFVLGFASVQTAAALTVYRIEIMGGATAYMTCGWHGDCDATPTSGIALDWGANGGHQVYFRSFMFRDSGSTETVARGTVDEEAGAACYVVWMNITAAPGTTYRGSEGYYHTTALSDGETIDIVGSTSGYWTQSHFASTVTSEKQGCPWTGEHLHERAYWENVSSSARNTGVYPNYVNENWYNIDTQGYWQDKASWTY